MKVLIIGSGGREHALAWKLSQSPKVERIYFTGTNGGMEQLGESIDIAPSNYEALADFARDYEVDLTLVGPEDPLCGGIVDIFEHRGLRIFGPNQAASIFEKSKDFTKKFLNKYDIPTASHVTCSSYDHALAVVKDFDFPLVIKADGLCLGKGVIICHSLKEAEEALKEIFIDKIFGQEGSKVVIEEFLPGQELSLLCFVSNNRLFAMETAQDHKKIFDGERGPNTGGVGAFSPGRKMSDQVIDSIARSLTKIEEGLNEEGFSYYGILFIGFMISGPEAKILEFNVRFGDPETEVLLPRLKSDLLDLMIKTLDESLVASDIQWLDTPALTTVLCSGGYPGTYEKGKLIQGLQQLPKDIIAFHNGTKKDGDQFFTNGGRVLSLTGLGSNLEEARKKVYEAIEEINFDKMYYRKDIGKRE